MHKDNISSGQHPEDQKYNSIPDLDIIDLDNDDSYSAIFSFLGL